MPFSAMPIILLTTSNLETSYTIFTPWPGNSFRWIIVSGRTGVVLKAQLHENVGAGLSATPVRIFSSRVLTPYSTTNQECRCQNSRIRSVFNWSIAPARPCPYRNDYPPESSHAGYLLKVTHHACKILLSKIFI